MNRLEGILGSFQKIASELPPVEISPRMQNILQKAAICPQMMGLGMEEVGVIDEEKIKGGAADGKEPEEIADEQGLEVDEVEGAIDQGQAIEMEHTDDANMAGEIATDHVEETTPDYYDELGGMEEQLKMEKEKGLGDPSPEDKEIIFRFLQTQQDLDDATLHKLYMALGVDPHEGEEAVYSAMSNELGDDPAAAAEAAQNAQEKEVEIEDGELEQDDDEVVTEENQAKPEEEPKKEYVKMASDNKPMMTATIADMFAFITKQAEAVPVAERKGPDDDDNQETEEVPTQIAKNSPDNSDAKGVSAISDETGDRKEDEDEEDGEKNEKVAEDNTPPSAGPTFAGSQKDKLTAIKELGVKFGKVKAQGSAPASAKQIQPESSTEKIAHIKQLSGKLGLIK